MDTPPPFAHILPNCSDPFLPLLLPFPQHFTKPHKLRQKMAHRTRALENLLPLKTRFKTADMLDEAFKYVKFLQAQLRALHSMPPLIPPPPPPPHEGGVLALLSSQQLLQVLLNSPSIQSKLYSQGLCVSSLHHSLN